jgi:hypothetical protein
MKVDPRSAPYHAIGSAELIWLSQYKYTELLLSGPAGTGKSRGCLEYLHYNADTYPNSRQLILRKTRSSITQTAMVTFENNVLPQGWVGDVVHFRSQEQEYRYPNGSIIAVGGMDKATKIMSSEYDVIYVQEAIELLEEDWESATTRLRNGRMPYQRLIADTNPSNPTHWLKKRCDRGSTKIVYCRHEDNPRLFNPITRKWTKEGKAYLAMLEKLTGVRKERLRFGKWVQAEGTIYADWNQRIHLLDRFTIPRDWPRYWSVDFGFTNPFVWQAWALDPDGRLIRYKEIYKTQTLVEDHAKAILAATAGEPDPVALICDHDAEGRATLEKHLADGGRFVNSTAAIKTVAEGIQAVQGRMRIADDGKPRLYLMRDSLIERDSRLDNSKRPACTEEEVDGYVWKPIPLIVTTRSAASVEEPVKKDDHGLDAMRYMVMQLDFNSSGKAIMDFYLNKFNEMKKPKE